MESVDQQIIDHLTRDGRMSYTDLGRATGLSTSAIHQRVRRLEERKVITGYHASIDQQQAGLPLAAFISIAPLDPAEPDDIPDRLREVTAIEACHSVAGDMSYLLQVRVATPHALEELIALIRARANVSTRTTVVLSTAWEGRAAVLPQAPADAG
ncbi:Lrp/AsnC family transcriptional regulator [Arsenicicoccus dermatophilus]|uniref:Lrp/AsnC family transcriptional regulator n=2 Tax=Arsenicicoccus dermatophilus TaxID=1076331 RepID=UPI0038927454